MTLPEHLIPYLPAYRAYIKAHNNKIDADFQDWRLQEENRYQEELTRWQQRLQELTAQLADLPRRLGFMGLSLGAERERLERQVQSHKLGKPRKSWALPPAFTEPSLQDFIEWCVREGVNNAQEAA